MDKKIKIKAPNLQALRGFLDGTEVDFGCRPVALKEGDKFYTLAKANDEQLGRLNMRRSSGPAGIEIEVIEELPDPKTKLRLVEKRNRFAGGGLPRGLGRKE